jgi:hypothetical protein
VKKLEHVCLEFNDENSPGSCPPSSRDLDAILLIKFAISAAFFDHPAMESSQELLHAADETMSSPIDDVRRIIDDTLLTFATPNCLSMDSARARSSSKDVSLSDEQARVFRTASCSEKRYSTCSTHTRQVLSDAMRFIRFSIQCK